jgi:hypothetical protein
VDDSDETALVSGSGLGTMNVLIGIDDTDNYESWGTGRLVQQLLAALEKERLGVALGATRHQLLVDPRIPYTSHNSSACVAWSAEDHTDLAAVIAYCSAFLEMESAPGSDPGLAVAAVEQWQVPAARDALVEFGRRAKIEVLDQDAARRVAADAGVHLSGHGGDEGGIIGALSAVGLHLSGADGLFVWMPGIRSLRGRATYDEVRAMVPIDVARDPAGAEPAPGDLIELGHWVRPVLSDGLAVLLLERPSPDSWVVAPREVVKTH